MFHGMKVYTVHIKPGIPHSQQRPIFVKEGFNIFAFAVPLFWALYQRLWLGALIVLVVDVLLIMMVKNHVVSSAGISVLDLGFHVLVGFEGNDWLRRRLRRQNFILADISTGDSLLRAEQRYFERVLAAA